MPADPSNHTRVARIFANTRPSLLGDTREINRLDDRGPRYCISKMSLEHIEGCGLGAARGLAYIAHVVDMKVHELAKSFQMLNNQELAIAPMMDGADR
ncbi:MULTISPECIES: hypothetical protein [Mesorhizobium]|uniref:hypothetical protein n=1 Tax=Mesorhizobium TaxID=68287 RepID=UPI0003CF5F4B|nr:MULTISPECIES: hypothetical protein [Mesorhizobium]ESY68954.1 hypothetical protein X742_09740 [Mesorhizobium sp. LNHC232B00]WJI40654.1 hypothetical protein NL534_10580 [Mesorhizobium opportunistum]